ncbi:MAG: lytic transglycosylase domain-containing protein, partial [Cyclobacteriaceae bacterium]
MKKAILFIASTLLYVVLGAQSVPDKMIFGNLKITIKPGAKVIMQENVDALTKSKPYFESIVERANTYFPIVEKRLKAVGVPDEIKYLCLQESSLIADAVSSSNAVGYWQFKKGTAEEVGLTVNRTIDERKNIVAASTGAAKYIKKHNKSLNNWGYALLSYYTGLGGVQKYVKKKYLGAKHMTIDQHTHWYLLKFLSHKIAFEHAIKKRSPKIALIENDKVGGKTIADLAKLYDVDKDEIKLYNRWIDFNKTIPKDKVYVAILPVAYDKKGVTQANENNVFAGANKLIDVIFGGEKVNLKELPSTFTVNGVKAIIPKSTDTYTDLAHQGGITLDELFAYNEMSSTTPVNKNTFYFLERKKKKALVNFHPAKEGETVHSISQLFGVRSSAILKKNRMKAASELKTGRVLWLRKTRSKKTPVKYGEVVIPKEEKTTLQPKGLEIFPVVNGKSPDIRQLPKPTAPEVIVPVIKKLPN